MSRSSPARRPRRWPRVLAVAGFVLLAILAFLWTAGMFDRDPVHVFAAEGRPADVAALYFSGDMGLRYGMGPATSRTLAAHGIETVGFNSSTLFAQRRTLAETNAIVARAVQEALARTHRDRIVLIGQSYGADVLQTGLAALPAALRPHVAAIVLVVPGETVFFRADPSGLVYRGTPDSMGQATARAITWAPLTCIYGVRETDSLCPLLHMANLRVIGMPGGHFLENDRAGLSAQVLAAIARARG